MNIYRKKKISLKFHKIKMKGARLPFTNDRIENENA